MLLLGDWAVGGREVVLTHEAPVVLGNLEGPILPRHPAFGAQQKAGPNLFSSQLPPAKGSFIFSLANNHLMDYGEPGLEATQTLLKQAGFFSCGAGKDVEAARQPLMVSFKGVRIGIVACCEAQFGVARRNMAGVAEFGPWMYRVIQELRNTVDAVIVSCHAGVEDSPWPSPYLRDLYHSFIDAGASVVHGHHAHVPQGYEEYANGLILYGMGNWAVDPAKWRGYSNGLWSLGAEIDFSGPSLGWQWMTFEIRETDSIVIEKSTEEERRDHVRYVELCNRPLSDPDLFAAIWQEVALRAYHHYGARYMRFIPAAAAPSDRRTLMSQGLALLRRSLLNRTAAPAHPGRPDYLLWYHMVACESHRQMLATALGILSGEIKDLRTDETRGLADEMMPWSLGLA